MWQENYSDSDSESVYDTTRKGCCRPEVDGSGEVMGVEDGVGDGVGVLERKKVSILVCFPVECCKSITSRRRTRNS